MSRENLQELSRNTLIGFTADRDRWAGNSYTSTRNGLIVPWHAQEDYTGGYPGPVPIEAVKERLFGWAAEEAPVQFNVPCDYADATGMNHDGTPYKTVTTTDFKAIYRSDTNEVFMVAKAGYQRHQYVEWLLTNVANIVDDTELPIESAFLLQQGGIAVVCMSLPDTVEGNANFPMLIRLVAFTSHNGRLASTYQLNTYSAVCDNSLDVNISEANQHGFRFRVKHTKYADRKVGSIRQALGLVQQHADDMVQFFDALAQWEVTDRDVKAVLDLLEPVPDAKVDDKGAVTNNAAITKASMRREEIARMYKLDQRAAPWQNSALGVLQAFNTWDQHERAGVKGSRAERQMMNTLSGDVAEFDSIVLNSLSDVTGWSIAKSEAGAMELVRVPASV